MTTATAAGEWRKVKCQGQESAYGGVPWDNPATLLQCDPYLVWLDITSKKRRNHNGKPVGSWSVPLLLELGPGTSLAKLRPRVLPTHLAAREGTCIPVVVRSDQLPRLLALTGADRPIRRLELCSPRFATADDLKQYVQNYTLAVQLTPAQGLLSAELQSMTGDFADSTNADYPPPDRSRRFDQRPPPASRVIVAVVDDGCNFASPFLWRDRTFSIRSVWHQTIDRNELARLNDNPRWTAAYSSASGPKSARGGLYGRVLRTEATLHPGAIPEELRDYESLRYPRLVRRWSHGSAVTAAIEQRSRGNPARNSQPPLPAVLAFTQLPASTVTDTTGGSLSCHVLEAIHDALDEAGENPVIVNLSYGNYSGAHDGTSLFERALKELLDRRRNLHVVLPAGNGHLSRTHASGRATSQHSVRLRWKVLPDNPDDVYLQLWFPESQRVCVDITAPGGERLEGLSHGHAQVWQTEASDQHIIHAAAVFPHAVPQGETGSMCLVCVGPTRARIEQMDSQLLERLYAPDRRPSVGPHGVWTIEIRSLDAGSVDFHAWIQRADEAPARWMGEAGHTGRQGYFLDDPETHSGTTDSAADPRFTLNGIATLRHDRLWVVGAMRQCDGGLSGYSAAGPDAGSGSRCHGPDVVVPADESIALPGLRVQGFLGPSRVRVSGTSMAAAVFTGELCRHLANGGSSDTFCFWPESDHRERPIAAAGEPERAPPGYRGSGQRWLTSAPYSKFGQCSEQDC